MISEIRPSAPASTAAWSARTAGSKRRWEIVADGEAALAALARSTASASATVRAIGFSTTT